MAAVKVLFFALALLANFVSAGVLDWFRSSVASIDRVNFDLFESVKGPKVSVSVSFDRDIAKNVSVGIFVRRAWYLPARLIASEELERDSDGIVLGGTYSLFTPEKENVEGKRYQARVFINGKLIRRNLAKSAWFQMLPDGYLYEKLEEDDMDDEEELSALQNVQILKSVYAVSDTIQLALGCSAESKLKVQIIAAGSLKRVFDHKVHIKDEACMSDAGAHSFINIAAPSKPGLFYIQVLSENNVILWRSTMLNIVPRRTEEHDQNMSTASSFDINDEINGETPKTEEEAVNQAKEFVAECSKENPVEKCVKLVFGGVKNVLSVPGHLVTLPGRLFGNHRN